MKMQRTRILYIIIIAWSLGSYYSCKDNSQSNGGIPKREINCYNNIFLTIVDTFGYYGYLIPPEKRPLDNQKIDRTRNNPNNFFSTNLIEEGISPVILIKDSLVNFTKINSLTHKSLMTKDNSFKKLIDKLYKDSTMPNVYFPITQINRTGKYTIRLYGDTTKNIFNQDKKVVGRLLLSRIIFNKNKACFYYEISNPNGPGMGKLVLLNKNMKGVWKIVSEVILWRS